MINIIRMTLAPALAKHEYIHSFGDTAWLIDTDRQATLSLWHERRKADTPQRLDVPFARIAAGLATLAAKDIAYCFIDTVPTISDQNTALLDVADLVLIPVRPSPSDLWAVGETVAQVKDAGKPFLSLSSPRPSTRRPLPPKPWPPCRSMAGWPRHLLPTGWRMPPP